jgi:hypothetical protein
MGNEIMRKTPTYKQRNYEHVDIQHKVKGVIHKNKAKEIPRKKKHKEIFETSSTNKDRELVADE